MGWHHVENASGSRSSTFRSTLQFAVNWITWKVKRAKHYLVSILSPPSLSCRNFLVCLVLMASWGLHIWRCPLVCLCSEGFAPWEYRKQTIKRSGREIKKKGKHKPVIGGLSSDEQTESWYGCVHQWSPTCYTKVIFVCLFMFVKI